MRAVVLLTAAISCCAALKIATDDSPVERVISMMTHMQKESVSEEEAETEIHNKKQCKCRLETEQLEKAIKQSDADAKVANDLFTSSVTAIASSQAQQADAEKDIKKYTDESRKMEDEFQTEMKNLDVMERQAVNDETALSQAEKVLTRGDNLLQAQELVRGVMGRVQVASHDFEHLNVFLQSKAMKASDMVTGIIKNMVLDLNRTIKGYRQTRAQKQKTHQATMNSFADSKAAARKSKQNASSAFTEASTEKLRADNDKKIAQDDALDARATLDTLTTDCRQAQRDYNLASAARREEAAGLGKAMEILQSGSRVLRASTSDAFIQMSARRNRAIALLQTFAAKAKVAKVLGMLQAADVKGKILRTIQKTKEDNEQSMKDLEDLQDGCISDMHNSKTEKARIEGERQKAANSVENAENKIANLDNQIAKFAKDSENARQTMKSSTENFQALQAENKKVIAANTQSIPILTNALNVLQKIYNPATRGGEHPILKLVEKIIDDCKSVVKDTTQENKEAKASHETEVDEAQQTIFDKSEAIKTTNGDKGRQLSDLSSSKDLVTASETALEGVRGQMEATIKDCKEKRIDTAEGIKALRDQIAKEREDLKQENSALTQAKQVLNGADFS